MRLIWCSCKSGIPCGTRDCGYKRYRFGLLDVHVQLYTIMQFSFETAAILDFIISSSFYSLINHFNEFLDPKNIGFDSKVIALCWIIGEFSMFAWTGGHLGPSLIEILIDCMSRSRIFHLYGDVTIAGEGLQKLGLCSALRAFEQGGIFIVPHLLWHGTSVFPVSSEGPPHLVASYDTRGDMEEIF
jgi:hypothetical protein